MPDQRPPTFAGSIDLELPEFDKPPEDPIGLLREWFDRAVELGVREPGVVALATVDADGHASNRIIQTIRITPEGLVFTSHSSSQKGRDIAANGQASGVLYWRETRQQIILTGLVRQLPDSESDALWTARPPGTHAMSVASKQSDPLEDEEALRAEARRLGDGALPRPGLWVGYRLDPTALEFWHGSLDRLHRRLRYDLGDHGWASGRLQP